MEEIERDKDDNIHMFPPKPGGHTDRQTYGGKDGRILVFLELLRHLKSYFQGTRTSIRNRMKQSYFNLKIVYKSYVILILFIGHTCLHPKFLSNFAVLQERPLR